MIKEIKVYKNSRILENGTLSTLGLGVRTDNEVDLLRFKFDDFVDGVGTLLTTLKDNNGNLIAFPLTKNEEENSYDLTITQALVSQLEITFQLQIVHESEVWNSLQATLKINDCLDIGSGEMPTTIENWLTNANIVLEAMQEATNEANNLNITMSDKVDGKVEITLTKKDGTEKSAEIEDGKDGVDGKDGASFEYNWEGTSLGVKTSEEQNYQYVNLRGETGPMGPQGNPFQIKKTYATKQAMIDDYDNMQVNDYVMIDGNVELQDNATLWVKEETPAPTTKWHYLADFSGATGIQGPTGASVRSASINSNGELVMVVE